MAKKISKAGDRGDDGVLRCPNCGSGDFEAKRSAWKKLLLAPLAFLIPFTRKKHVRCEACGETFRRG